MARRRATVIASDGRREDISWYEGATEAAVLRCARVALGLSTTGAAHLALESGDLVDFDEPIADGVTLHLEVVATCSAVPSRANSGSGGHGGGLVYSFDDCGSAPCPASLSGGGGDRGFFSDGCGGRTAVVHRRSSCSDADAGCSGGRLAASAPATAARPRGYTTDRSGGGGRDRWRQRLARPDEPISWGLSSSLAQRRTLLAIRHFFGVRSGREGVVSRFLEKATSAAAGAVGATDSDDELERLPLLLGIDRGPVSQVPLLPVTSLSSFSQAEAPSSGSGGRSSGGGGGNSGGGAGGSGWGGEVGGDEVDGSGGNPEHQRGALLKLKRINAHLANERTFLAWVRCVGKMFSAGVTCFSLAMAGRPAFALCFVGVGMTYIALGPYVVIVGARRFHQAKAVMHGSAHDAYLYFAGAHLRGLTSLMVALAALTVMLMGVLLVAAL